MKKKQESEFDKFENLARRVVNVPKSEVLKLERKRKKRKSRAKR